MTIAYCLIDTDSASKLVQDINKILKKLQDMQKITKAEYWKMRAVASNVTDYPMFTKKAFHLDPSLLLMDSNK